MWLGRVPAGLHQDEALSGYDAYSILMTARDHHGNLLPIVFQGFNDYRMALFEYTLVPLVGLFGLKASAIRLGAALWGLADLGAIASLAGLTLGFPAAAVAALLVALSPWHLIFSRFGHCPITASATVDLATLCFVLWLTWRKERWLLLSGAMFGVSFYSYEITKVFVPLFVGLLGLLYWRELRRIPRQAAIALAILVLIAAPQAIVLTAHLAETQARIRQISVFNGPLSPALATFVVGWLSHFGPSYLFLSGDQTPNVMLQPPGFGHLLPVQALLIPVGLISLFGLFGRGQQRLGLLLVGWLILAAIPPAMTIGAPDFERNLTAVAPWTLLSAAGFVALLDFAARVPALKAAAAVLILAGIAFHAVRFVTAYMRDYPAQAARFFQYGVGDVVREVDKLDDGRRPIVITPQINQAYIYVLFFNRYSPARFQQDRVLQMKGLFGAVIGFDHYIFLPPPAIYKKIEHGIFVCAPDDGLTNQPVAAIRYPDGELAYNLVVK